MNIKLIKLKDGGLKGGEIHHIVPVEKGNRKTVKLVKEYPKDPMHKELRSLFEELKRPLLSICDFINGVDESEVKYMLLETEVTGIEFSASYFVITGEKRILKDKFFKLKTCKVEEVDIDNFIEIMEIISKIVDETALYFNGDKKVSDDELVESWVSAGKDKHTDMDTYNLMTPEEKREYHTRILEEEFGSIVTNMDDMGFEEAEEITETPQLALPQAPGEVLTIVLPEKQKANGK